MCCMNPRPLSEDIAKVTQRSAEANTVLIRGDIDGYLALIEHSKDYTLMAPFGRSADTRLRPVEPGHNSGVLRVPHVRGCSRTDHKFAFDLTPAPGAGKLKT